MTAFFWHRNRVICTIDISLLPCAMFYIVRRYRRNNSTLWELENIIWTFWSRVDMMFTGFMSNKKLLPPILVDKKTHKVMPSVDMLSGQKQQFPSGCQKYLLPIIEVTHTGRTQWSQLYRIYFECFTQECCILIQIPSIFVSYGVINNGPDIDLVPNRGLAINCTCVNELNKLVVVL